MNDEIDTKADEITTPETPTPPPEAAPVPAELKFFSILNRWTDAVLYSGEYASLGAAVVAAVKSGASLDGANLDGANLDGASLTRANLDGASLTRANLTRANLDGASLYGASLDGANLTRANLTRANLDGASLTRANLDGANLDGANLDGANLTRANLDGANLTRANLDGASLYGASLDGANLDGASLDSASSAVPDLAEAKADLWLILGAAVPEIPAVRKALLDGRVDGSTYTGECKCLVGTIAAARGCYYETLDGIDPDANRPAERFFAGIGKGHLPAVNWRAAMAVLWIDEYTAAHPVAAADGLPTPPGSPTVD